MLKCGNVLYTMRERHFFFDSLSEKKNDYPGNFIPIASVLIKQSNTHSGSQKRALRRPPKGRRARAFVSSKVVLGSKNLRLGLTGLHRLRRSRGETRVAIFFTPGAFFCTRAPAPLGGDSGSVFSSCPENKTGGPFCSDSMY